ncbi:hypothetical protein TGME49_247450 [Toxoplasma gondii ME49]|uniref:C3H1-type domain-containing protein n=7 Tax=Toxoplasma gondii TaxID=5811 RepID=B6KGY9_TOXGV|nr:hypothetical protein TGME49_247450 [Toxoplasma gondii ME49]EPT24933.1 hypothetical protein TGME49_247450 [Toxoplasma gondii ME49]ESS34131.1 hypothetical protein TGVEG_247450 [Toxoplasma gondii VEG]KFG46774.1 hypothetical protein TGDOM2_247450 [Toxoplasma gondii GAB2-2007-GAL-DOM2]CEL78397.1 TPA: hypothetical protein BN1205_004550 [Toxoplasma gondii VEG]|eukprot:XP_002367112.1 hypothetical protein TGME49_247450 [Toxoplasma gondii ME49]
MDDFSPGRRSPRGISREAADRRRGSPRWPSRDREERRSPWRSSSSRGRGEEIFPSRGGVRREGASPEPKSGRDLPRANSVQRDDELASRRRASGRRDSREGVGRDRRTSTQRDARGPLSPPYGSQRRFERRSPSPYRGGEREARSRGENDRKRGRSRESSEGGRQVRRESRRIEEGEEGGFSHFGYRGDEGRRDEPRGDRGGRGGEDWRREDPGRRVLSERDEEFASRDNGAGRDREARETDERESSLSRPLPRDKRSRDDSSERREDRQGSRRGTVASLEDRSRRRVSRSPGQGKEKQERGSLSSFYSVREREEREGREEREEKGERGSEKADELPRGERRGGSVAEASRRAEGEKDRFSGGREETSRRRESPTGRRRLSSDSLRLPETGRDRSSDSIGERGRRSPPRGKDDRDEPRREDDSGRGDNPPVGRRERSGSAQKNEARRSATREEERTKTRRNRVSSLSPETDKGEPASVSFQEAGKKPPRRLPLPPPPLVSRGGRGERDGEEDKAGPRPRRGSEDNSRENHKRMDDRNRDHAPQSPVAARRRQTSFCLRIENLPSSPSRSEIADLLRDCCGIRVPIDMVELFPADARAVVYLQSQQQAESAQYRLHRRTLRNCRLDVFLGDRAAGRDSRDDDIPQRDKAREDSRGSRSPRRRGASPGRGEEARERCASPAGSSFRILRPRSPPGPTGGRASSPVRRGRRSPPRPLIIRPGPSGGAFPGGIEVLPTDFARGDRRRDEDDERRGQRGADRRGYGRGSLSPRGRSACGAREAGSSRSPKRRRRDEDLSSDSRRRRTSRSLSRSPMNGDDKGPGLDRGRTRDDRSASREGRKASVSQSSRRGREAGEKEKGEKGSSLSPEGRGGRLSSSRPYTGPEETSREPKAGACSNLGPRPRSRSPPQGGSRRFGGLGGPHGSTPGISIRLAGRGGSSRDYMDGRGPGSGGRGRSPSPHSRRRGGSPRRGWRPPAPRFGLGSVSRSRSRASHSLTASEKSDRRERDEDTKGEKRRDSVVDGKSRRRSLSRRSQEREGGARSDTDERNKARGPSPLNRERASDVPGGERRQERDRSSGRLGAERRDRSVKQNPQEKAMLRLHERGRCTPCRQIIKGLECFRISTCPYCHHAEHDPMYNRPGVEEPELEASSLLSLASAGLQALRDGVDAGAGQQGEEESRPRGRSASLSPSAKSQTKPGGGNSALSPMVLKQHLAGTCLPCSEYKQDRCRRGDSCPFCHHSDHLPKGEKAKGEPKKKEAKKLDSKEQQERYALERHEKGWCRPCKKYFAKNAECPAVKKNQPCLYCHHEDHRDDMPSRIQSRQPSPERASPPAEPLKMEEAPPQDTSAPLLASPPHSLHSPSSLCSPTAQGAMGEQGNAGPAILRPGDPATRLENFVFADPAQQRKHEKGLCLPCKFYVSGRQCYKVEQGCVYCHHPSHLSLAVQGLSQHADGTGLPCLQKVREQHEQGVCRPCVHHFVPGLTCAWGVQCLLCHHPQHGDRSSPSFYLKWEHDRNVCLPCAKAHVSGHGGCPESDNCGYCHDPVHSDPTSELHFARVLHARGVCRPCQQFLQGTCPLEQLCCPFCHNPQHLGGFAAEKEGERERGAEGAGPPGRGAVVPVSKIGPAAPPGHALFMRPPGTDGRTAPGLPFPPQQPAGNVPLSHPGLPGPPMGHPPPLAHPAGVGAAGMFPGPPHHPVRPAFVYGGVPPPSGTAVAGSPFPGQPPMFAGAGAGAALPGNPTKPQKEEREGAGEAGPGEGVKESLGLPVGVIAAPPVLGGAPKEEEQGAKEEEELDPVAAAAAAYAKEQEARQVLLQNQSVMQTPQSMTGPSPPGGSPWGVPYMQPPPPGAAPWGAPGAPHPPSGSMPAGTPQGPHPIGVGPPPPGPPGTAARPSHLLPTPPGAPGVPPPGSRQQAQMGPPLAMGGDRAMPSMPGAPPPGAAPPAPMYGMAPAMGRPPAPAQAPGSFCGPIGSPAGIRPPQGPPGAVGTGGPPGYMGSESSFGVSHLAPGQRPAPPHPHGSPAPFASPSAQKPSPPPLMGWGAQPLVASQPPPPGGHLTPQGDAGQGVGLAGPPPGMSPAMGTGAPPPPPPPPSGSPSDGFGDSSAQASGSSFQASLAAKNPAAAAMLEAAQQAAQAAASKIGSSNSSPPPPPSQSFLNQSSRVPGMSPAAAAAAAAAAALAAAAMAAKKKGEEAQKVRDMEQPQGSKPSQAMAGLPAGHATMGTPLPSPFGFSVGSRSGGLASVVEAAKAAVAQKALLAAREAQEAPTAAPDNPQNLPAGVLAAAEAAKAAAAAISASLAGVGGFTG